MNENFSTFAKFLGSGNPHNKIWFIGIEEGGESVTIANLKEKLELCKRGYIYFDNANSSTQVWDIIAELTYEKFKSYHDLSFKEYRNKMFCKSYSFFFLTELFPIPKPSTKSWPENYKQIFSYNPIDYYKYLSDIRSFRYPFLYNKWKECKPDLTICFGISYWNEFINLLSLGHSNFEGYENVNLQYFPNANVLLTPFFNRRIIKQTELTIVTDFIKKIKHI